MHLLVYLANQRQAHPTWPCHDKIFSLDGHGKKRQMRIEKVRGEGRDERREAT